MVITPDDARTRWNQRFADEGWPEEPSPFLLEAAGPVPPGKALDVAGGPGRNAVWLAERGWAVTLIDISDVALRMAARRAAERGVDLDLVRSDVAADPLPGGPWDLVVLFHFLERRVFAEVARVLHPEGRFVGELATVRNLERHPRPRRPFVLEEGEAPRLLEAAGFEVLHLEEGWFEDRHQVRFVAVAGARR